MKGNLFIRTLKSSKVYNDKLGDIANEYNNTYHRTIKMKPVGVKSDFYAEYNANSNNKDPNLVIM